jgi:hypothetical protein
MQEETLSDLKKQRTKLFLMQYALGDYPKPQDVKSKIALSLKDQVDEVDAKIKKFEQEQVNDHAGSF